MNKASELRKSLADTLPADQIDTIVAGAIARGDVDNDEGTGGLTPDVVKSLMGELRGSLADVETETESIAKSNALFEAEVDEEDDYIDVEATLNSVVKSANSSSRLLKALVKQSAGTDGALAGGVLALGQLTEHILSQQASLAKSVAETSASIDAISKAMRIPVPPRAVTGAAQTIPHPGEVTKSGGLVADAPVDAGDLVAKCMVELQGLENMNDSVSLHKGQQLAQAVSQLNSGVSVAQVIKDLPIIASIASA